MTEETNASVTQPEEETKSELPTGEDVKSTSEIPVGDAPVDSEDTPPEVAGEEADNPDPSYLGQIEEPEQQAILALQQKHQQMVFQLGNTVLRIFQTVDQVGAIEEQVQNTYQAIGKRLNIGPKTRWSVMQDGSVRAMPNPPGPQIVPPPAPEKPEGDEPEK